MKKFFLKPKNQLLILEIIASALYVPIITSPSSASDRIIGIPDDKAIVFGLFFSIALILLIFSVYSAAREQRPLLILMGVMPLVSIIGHIIVGFNHMCLFINSNPTAEMIKECNDKALFSQIAFGSFLALIIIICYIFLSRKNKK